MMTSIKRMLQESQAYAKKHLKLIIAVVVLMVIVGFIYGAFIKPKPLSSYSVNKLDQTLDMKSILRDTIYQFPVEDPLLDDEGKMKINNRLEKNQIRQSSQNSGNENLEPPESPLNGENPPLEEDSQREN